MDEAGHNDYEEGEAFDDGRSSILPKGLTFSTNKKFRTHGGNNYNVPNNPRYSNEK